jgi:hypothetical protein
VAFARVLDLIREGRASKQALMTVFRPWDLALPGNIDAVRLPSPARMSLAATTGGL